MKPSKPPAKVPTVPQARPMPVNCTRCNLDKRFVGTGQFHEGRRWGILGDLGELFVNKAKFDVYACPRCGSVEFFVDGVGEARRPPE